MAATKPGWLKGSKARRIVVEEYCGYVHHCGTREQVIEAGLAADGQIPGDAACPGRTAFTFKRDTRSVTVRVRTPGNFWVVVGPSADEKKAEKEERNKRDAEQRKQRANEEAARVAEARAKADEIFSEVPKSANVYKRELAARLNHMVRAWLRPILSGAPVPDDKRWFLRAIVGYSGGFTIDSDALAEFDEAIGDAMEILRNASVRFDARRKNQERLEILGPVAKSDRAFEKFMAAATDSTVTAD